MKLERTLREVVRHLILKSGFNDAYIALRARRGQKVDYLRSQTLTERFSTIYRDRVWLNERAEGSLSGLGSDIENTQTLRQRLPDDGRRHPHCQRHTHQHLANILALVTIGYLMLAGAAWVTRAQPAGKFVRVLLAVAALAVLGLVVAVGDVGARARWSS